MHLVSVFLSTKQIENRILEYYRSLCCKIGKSNKICHLYTLACIFNLDLNAWQFFQSRFQILQHDIFPLNFFGTTCIFLLLYWFFFMAFKRAFKIDLMRFIYTFWSSPFFASSILNSKTFWTFVELGLDWTWYISFLTGQDPIPKLAGQVLPDQTESGLIFLNIKMLGFSKEIDWYNHHQQFLFI